jgi:molybdenum cofactor biosynthesis protein B
VAKKNLPFEPLNAALVTISNSRTVDDDGAGDLIAERLEQAGHRVVQRRIHPEQAEPLRALFREWIRDPGVDVVISSGGTGLTSRDVAPEVIQEFVRKPIPGFGELFRMLSFEDIGSSAIESRAEACVADNTLIFLLPGSPGACRLAMDQLILGQLDARHRPCNLVTLLPRILDQIKH